MPPSPTTIAGLYVGATLVALAAAMVVARRRRAPGARPLALMLVATAIWALCDAVELWLPSAALRRLVSQVQYFGVISAAPFFLHTALAVSGRRKRLPTSALAIVWIVPLLTLVVAWTSQWHHWLWTAIHVPPGGQGPGVYEYGPWFWVLTADHYVLSAVGCVALLRAARRVGRPFRQPIVVLVAAILLPWIGNIIYVFKLGPWAGVNWLTLSINASGVVLANLAFRAGLFDLLPAARDAIVDLIPDSIVIVDREARLLLANRSARSAFDLPDVDRPVSGPMRALVGAAAAGTADPGIVELPLPGTSEQWVEVRSRRIADRWGNHAASTVLITDITARKHLDQEREAQLARAARDYEAKSAFIANVSHEIRTPLNGVIGMTALLLDTPLQREQRENLELLRASGEALLSLVDDVLDYSRLTSSRLELERLPFDVRDVVADSVRILSARSRGKDLDVTSEVDASVPARVIGDPARLRQALLNLGGNAVKFTERGFVRVRVHLERAANEAVTLGFRIEDSGPGIPSEQLGRIFRPFTQADASISRRFGGTGLGLSICRLIVEQMGGTIAVESEVDRGSTFSFSIACAVAEAGAAPGSSQRSTLQFESHRVDGGRQRTRAPRVLVAEDDPVNRVVIRALLAKLGCTVDVVDDGTAAVAKLGSASYDLVLMDCQMPRMDGFEATERIRRGEAGASGRDVPILALTASATADTKARCLGCGMSDYLTKPITPIVLQRALDRWIPADDPSLDAGQRAS